MATVPTMTAVVSDRYGPPEVLRVCQVPTPSPKPDEVRVRIIASAVTASDIFIRSAHVSARLQVPFRLMMGVTKPRHPILGFVFSGVIDQTGAKTSRFTPGDAVYGGTGFRLGAYAEYRCMIDSDSRTHGTLALKPTNLTHEQATAAAYAACSHSNTSTRAQSTPDNTSSSTARPEPPERWPSSTPSHWEHMSPPSAARKTLTSSDHSEPTRSWTTPGSTPHPRARATPSSWTPSAT